jgi:ribonuclease HI
MSRVVIFTDGASKGNPGPGGWGAIVATDGQVRELGGHEPHTTNNRMELQAAYEALSFAATLKPQQVTVYADSSYVIQGATKWGAGWRRNGWITSTKQPVLNKDIWEPFLDLLDTISTPIKWHNIGGHIGIPGNERVDTIASNFATGDSVELYSGGASSYGIDISHVAYDADLKQRKSDSKTRSKAKAYSYVSEVDGVVQVHKTWGECEARVRGRSARFKKALSPDEERNLVRKFSGS